MSALQAPARAVAARHCLRLALSTAEAEHMPGPALQAPVGRRSERRDIRAKGATAPVVERGVVRLASTGPERGSTPGWPRLHVSRREMLKITHEVARRVPVSSPPVERASSSIAWT